MATQKEFRMIEHVDYFKVADNIWYLKDIFVNIYMIGNPVDKTWVLVDAGLKTTAKKIRSMAVEIFGENARPSCIILTHAHFDHVGSLKELAAEWNVPVYAHYLELPYLTGQSSYPPPDPSVGGGMMARMAWAFPHGSINMNDRVTALPDDEVPFLWGWKYFHTPGHAPGHISLFRLHDKVLIAGDALLTTKMESFWSVMLQSKILSGPPKVFTYDWEKAQASVNTLWMLEPEVLATGHGKPMRGHEMRLAFNQLENEFEKRAVPKKGRYVNHPARANATGVTYIPPKPFPVKLVLISSLILAAAAAGLISKKKKNKFKRHPLKHHHN